ncbi:hypothetical protein K492DRAFT_32776 [Lichtheimia hyalospora FSU 10163]|nr:hypothetical protein K492DRAFT_32776 [Lichtheimia hyalospora FSU 10163]
MSLESDSMICMNKIGDDPISLSLPMIHPVFHPQPYPSIQSCVSILFFLSWCWCLAMVLPSCCWVFRYKKDDPISV